MASGECSIDEDLRLVVDGAEIQQDFFSVPVLRDRDVPMIPHIVDEVLELHSRQLAFRAEGNSYFLVESFGFEEFPFQAGSAEIKRKRPLAIEIVPCIAFELRPWILGPWHG